MSGSISLLLVVMEKRTLMILWRGLWQTMRFGIMLKIFFQNVSAERLFGL